jgi:hypothetical protein
MGSKSSNLFIGLSALLLMLAYAGPAKSQSFNANAEKKARFGNNVMKFKNVPVNETSDTKDLVITTSQKTVTLSSINVKEPFVEEDCSCTIAGFLVDCDSESLPLEVPPATTCRVGVAFSPTSAGKVVDPFGVRIDFDASNTPKFVELIGIGVE